jgi:hypothetical protein
MSRRAYLMECKREQAKRDAERKAARALARVKENGPALLAACKVAERAFLSSNPLDYKVGLAAVRDAIAAAETL